MFNKDNVVKLLELKGWTNYRLAKEAGLGQSTIHEIMSGKKTTPNSTTLQKMATALGVSVDSFFDNNINKISTDDNSEIDFDMRRIERARSKMKLEDKEKMMKILELSFEQYFDDED